MAADWHEWHRAYDEPESPLSRRLAVVQGAIRTALDAAPPGEIRVISMSAGKGRDVLGVLDDHSRAVDVRGRLVELDAGLAATARTHAPSGLEVFVGDAGLASSYAGAVPADLVLICGVFGNIADADVKNTVRNAARLCAPDATVIWTRHRRPPDGTPQVRAWFREYGFDEVAFTAPDGTMFGVGAHRLQADPQPFDPAARYFSFVGYDSLGDACPTCGFSYDMGEAEITTWLRSDARAFVERLAAFDDAAVRTRPAPDVWSPLEYACHVRDVLRVQRARAEQAQHEDEPTFTPMGRDERVIEDRYNEQDPSKVATEILAAAADFADFLDGLDDAQLQRRGLYNYPQPELRTVQWIGIHTVHELLHHRVDIGTSE